MLGKLKAISRVKGNLGLSIFISALIISLPIIPNSSAATIVKSGATCITANQKVVKAGKTFVCKKKGKKLVWQIIVVKPTTPGTTAPSIPVAPTNRLAVYSGGSGGAGGEKSFELPRSVTPPPANANLKLWVYHPSNKNQALNIPGIWLKKTGEDWKWQSGNNPDGSLYFTAAEGSYIFDTVEPNGNSKDFGRRTYSLTVDSAGKPSIRGLQPNSAGYFTVTLIDRSVATPPFNPATRCQLPDVGVNPGMNVGFSKSTDRLRSVGVIKALILPIDFTNLVGTGDPAEVFYPMAADMNKYFNEMSNNQVSFDYKVLPTWHRANFDPAKFNLGTWGSGDPGGYYAAALASADSVVDYSQFDVVYVLSPTSIPWSLIAYGPAFPSIYPTDDGPVKNGTMSGADAYQNGKAWQWMAHETGHLFGIFDLYTVPPQANVYGDWDLMSNNWGDLVELNSWNRYIQGWLADSQVRCLEANQLSTAVEVTITPLNQRDAGIKSAVVRLSDTEVLVAEVRRNGGYDRLDTANEGVLVYKVDLKVPSIKGGYQTQRRPGSKNDRFLDAALRPGDKVKVGNIQIEVVSKGATGDVVRFSN